MSDKLPPCNQSIFKDGSLVAVLTGSSASIEEAVIRASESCGFNIDWHRSMGRAVVKTLGDPSVARSSLLEQQTEDNFVLQQ